MTVRDEVINKFEELFGGEAPILVRAPGRVNLIGEHTDYNDGFVFPMTIDRAVWIALRPRQDRTVRVYLPMFEEFMSFQLDDVQELQPNAQHAIEYLKGMAWAMQSAGYNLRGWEGVLHGDVPGGAGLSSSAAFEMAVARAFVEVSGLPWEPAKMALLGQQAENQWVGVQTGIMDQMISASGKADHALLIDCRTLETEQAPLPPNVAVVVLDTSTRRGLVGSKYNERREQCEQAAQFFGVDALRDVSFAQFSEKADQLEPLVMMRARHVISENERTLQAKKAMVEGDAKKLGQLMNESHISMRDDFEITNAALNVIVDCAQAHEACYGARMTGGGFGGCAVAIIREDAVDEFVKYVNWCFHDQTRLEAKIYVCKATNGAEVVTQS